MKNKKGFTLIELILVIVLISAVALITLPNIFDMLNSGKDKKYVEFEKLLIENLKLYNIDHKEELWDFTFTSEEKEIPYDQAENGLQPLLSSNPDINLDNCTVVNGGLKIARTNGQYNYSVCMHCEMDDGSYNNYGGGCEEE